MRPFKPVLGICTITNELSRLITHDLKSNQQLGSFHDSMLFMMFIVPAVLQSVSSPLMAGSQAHNQDTGGECGMCMLSQRDIITNHAQHHAEKIGISIIFIATIQYIIYIHIYVFKYINISRYKFIYIYHFKYDMSHIIIYLMSLYIILLSFLSRYLPTTIVQANYHSEDMWWACK